MNVADEGQRLQGVAITELLNEISDLKRQAVEEQSHFYVANILGKCHETVKRLHIVNTEIVRENKAINDNRRLHFAGQAMQALIQRYGNNADIMEDAFAIATDMVTESKK